MYKHLRAVPKTKVSNLLNEPKNLVDYLQALGDMKQELFELLESVELLEEEVKQVLYTEQGTRKK